MKKPYYSASEYYKDIFGEKVYRISINAGFTCPNRDGTISTGGCIYCSEGGSGDFASDPKLSIKEQLKEGRVLISSKTKKCHKFIAYFQAYTNTYGSVDDLKKKYEEAINEPYIVGLSIATRPDCISNDCLDLLKELNKRKPIWVELGLQTIHQNTAGLINRGYGLICYDEAVERLKTAGIKIITHVIIGLPGETESMMLDTVKYVVSGGIDGIKLQLLHVLRNTMLEKIYEKEHFKILSLEEYGSIIKNTIELIPSNVAIFRLTGDPPKRLLIEPKWAGDKKRVLNYLNKVLSDTGDSP